MNRRGGAAAGVSLVEVCGATAVVGAVTAIALTMVPSWLDDARQDAATTSLTSVLKVAQQRAVGEGRAMCVELDLPAQTWSVKRGQCDPAREGVTFFANGSATPKTMRLGADNVTVDASGDITGG